MKKFYRILLTGFLLLILVSTVSAETEIEAFTEVGEHTWNVPDNVDEVDVLVVGGGGAGGNTEEFSGTGGGGGGAGGLVFYPSYNIDDSIIGLEVGGGGEQYRA